MKTAEILSIFQEKLLLNFKESSSYRVEIKKSSPPKQSIQFSKYEAPFDIEANKQIHELLKLCKCKESPFFKWITPQRSFYGFGNYFNENNIDLFKSDNLSENLLFQELGKQKEIAFFHALPFPSKQTADSNKDSVDPIWNDWKFPHFLVPEVSIEIQASNPNILTLTIIQNAQTNRCKIEAFEFPKQKNEFKENFISKDESIEKEDDSNTKKEANKLKKEVWNKQIKQILSEVNTNSSATSKVVLARTKELSPRDTFSPTQLFDYLSSLHNSNLLTHFYLGIGEEAFFGFSPENLLNREGNEISIDAIAGTRPRSDNDKDDSELEEELKNSQKEQSEHANVIDAIIRNCEPLGEVKQHQQVVLKLSKVQHLKTPISLKLRKIDKTTIYQLAKILHPTPAVGGTPRRESLDMISELENFKRGLYAGAIGLQTQDSDQFIVAIRSLKTSTKKTTLFAGAGIVEGSTPSDEWNETEAKFNSFFPPNLLYNKEKDKE